MQMVWPTKQGIVDNLAAAAILALMGFVGALMLTALIGLAQSMQGVSPSWGLLGSVFVASLTILIGLTWLMTWFMRKRDKQLILASLPADPLPLSSATPWFVDAIASEPQDLAPLYFLVATRSYVNPPDRNDQLMLWVALFNGGTATVHLGKLRWEANMGKAFGYPHNVPLIYQYEGGRGQGRQRIEEVDIGSGEHVRLWLLLDPEPGFEKIREWKNLCTLGTLTIPVTFGDNGQQDLSVPL